MTVDLSAHWRNIPDYATRMRVIATFARMHYRKLVALENANAK